MYIPATPIASFFSSSHAHHLQLRTKPNYYQSEAHLLKFQQLQNRGLTITKNYIVNFLKQTSLSITSTTKVSVVES